jgi:hypothetical protein
VTLLDGRVLGIAMHVIASHALAGPSAKEAIPDLDRMREDPNAVVRKQAQSVNDRIKSNAESSQDNGNARKTAST